MPKGKGVYYGPGKRGRPPGIPYKSGLRTGRFIRDWLLEKEEDHPSEIHRGLRDAYYTQYPKVAGKRVRYPPTFHSFLRYFHALIQLGLLEFTGREEPMEFPGQTVQPDLLQLRDHQNPEVVKGVCRFYCITPGANLQAEEWDDPFGVLRERRQGVI